MSLHSADEGTCPQNNRNDWRFRPLFSNDSISLNGNLQTPPSRRACNSPRLAQFRSVRESTFNRFAAVEHDNSRSLGVRARISIISKRFGKSECG